jgi:membrane protease YdiL (CAAX protease family)
MAGPYWGGVHDGMQRARRGERHHHVPRPSAGRAWTYFFVVTLSLSWATAFAFGGPSNADHASWMVRLFWASVYYALVMGWQPLVGAAVARWARNEPRVLSRRHRPRVRDVALAIGVAIGLAAIATITALALGEPGGFAGLDAADVAGASIGAVLVLCAQAATEEYGWRGAPLVYAVEQWGARAGLIVHGLAWGAWYAPLFLLSSETPQASLPAAGGFTITCLLLGIVFGWLRLRTGSVIPSAIANAVLTITAGLPLLLQDGSTGARDAVFRWPGWPVIGAVALIVLVFRGRDLALAREST